MGDYELVHTIRFESARKLIKVPAGHPCGNIYGLSFKLDIHVRGSLDNETDWVIDFDEIEKKFESIKKQIDHNYLNDIKGLENPTTEIMITWIWNELKPTLPSLTKLVLKENEKSRVIYSG